MKPALRLPLLIAGLGVAMAVLALAGVAAHEVVRPAAPIAAYLLGAAVATSPGQPVADVLTG